MHDTNHVHYPNYSKVATIFFIKKGLYAMLLMGVLPIFAQITASVFGAMPTIIAVIFMLVIVSPELGLLSARFRKIIFDALSDHDGRFDKSDLIDTLLIYATVLPVRAVSFGYLYMMVGGWEPSYDQLYGPLIASVASSWATYLNKKK